MRFNLSSAEVALLRLTFWEANADAKAFAAALTERLGILAPGIQAQLPRSLEHCVRDAIADIEAALMVAHEQDQLQGAVERLTSWYYKYNLLPHEAHMFRESLLLTLESRLQRSFDAAKRSIWRKASNEVSTNAQLNWCENYRRGIAAA